MDQYDYNPYSLPQDLLAAIGLAISAANQTEKIVNDAIAGLAGIAYDRGGAITTHMNMALRFNVLMSLGDIVFLDKDVLAEFDTLVLAIQTAFVKRNAYAHNEWAVDKNENVAGQIVENARTQYEIDLVPTTVEEVQVAARELYVSGLKLMEFMGKRRITVPIPDALPEHAHPDHAARKNYRKQWAAKAGLV